MARLTLLLLVAIDFLRATALAGYAMFAWRAFEVFVVERRF